MLLALGQAQHGASPSDTIRVGVDLQLGLSRDAVLSRLGDKYKLTKIGPMGDSWVVESSDSSAASYGSLVFKNGILDSASKNWSHVDDEGTFAFVNSFHQAVQELA